MTEGPDADHHIAGLTLHEKAIATAFLNGYETAEEVYGPELAQLEGRIDELERQLGEEIEEKPNPKQGTEEDPKAAADGGFPRFSFRKLMRGLRR